MQLSIAKEVSLEQLTAAIEGANVRAELDLGVVKILCMHDTVSGDFVALSTSEGRCAILG